MPFRSLCFLVLVIAVNTACKKSKDNPVTPPVDFPVNGATPLYSNVAISTDKASYSPGMDVTFTIDISKISSTAKVRYRYLNETLAEEPVSSSTWKWKTPAVDFQGYTAEVYDIKDSVETIYAVIGIDVSSDWAKFPRYGFLSDYPLLSSVDINSVITDLNRHHINGIQFYDWQYKHHRPLAGTPQSPAPVYKDIINRDIYFSTVSAYIDAAHQHNIKAMFYNLIYGAWDDAENDGVMKEWYVYDDNTHTNRDFHPLSAPFLSNIYLLDPSNTGWQQYIENENKKVYTALPFDGYHMDQLGDRGAARYRYDGTYLDLSKTFVPFINAVKADEPEKAVVMNAVNQYGQTGIAQSTVDFLYTEVWSPNDTYADLASLIQANNVYSSNTKNTVLAAYMNYDLADQKGYFNTPSVLMTNAVIFAFGGSHLELGEHMLAKEYFPNDNLSMKDDLKKSLVNYYDFLVAYQNLLRDGGTFNKVTLTSSDHKMNISNWPPANGVVAAVGKKAGNNQVIHLINFKSSKTQNWRDNTALQVAPAVIKDAKLVLTSSDPVKKIWVASPDIIGGASEMLNFSQHGDQVSFTLPELQYWDMIVIEY